MKSGKLNLLEAPRPVQACSGTAVPHTYDFTEYSHFASPLFLGEFDYYRWKRVWNGNTKTNYHCIFRCSKLVFHRLTFLYVELHWLKGGRYSVVGIATRYGLEGPGIESRWCEIFRTSPDLSWGVTGKVGRGVTLTILVPRSKKE
jgi:hypothetical protein